MVTQTDVKKEKPIQTNTRAARAIVHPESLTPRQQRSRGRGRTPREKREAYAKFAKVKEKVWEFEKTNTKLLVLYPASDFGVNDKYFYVMGGHSALIYVHDLAPRMGRKKRDLRTDEDNGEYKFKTGITMIKDLAKLEEELAKINVKRLKKENAEGVVYFKLDREYTVDEIVGMYKLEKERRENVYAMILPEVSFPDIHKAIIELKRLIPHKVAKMNSVYRDMLGPEMINSTLSLMRNYGEMTHGHKDAYAAAQEMLKASDMLLEMVSLCLELELFDIATCARIVSVVVGMNRQIVGRIINKKGKTGSVNKN